MSSKFEILLRSHTFLINGSVLLNISHMGLSKMQDRQNRQQNDTNLQNDNFQLYLMVQMTVYTFTLTRLVVDRQEIFCILCWEKVLYVWFQFINILLVQFQMPGIWKVACFYSWIVGQSKQEIFFYSFCNSLQNIE